MNHPELVRLKGVADQGIQAFLDRWPADGADGLYAPIHYLMQLGGKRLRPVLGLAAAEAEGGVGSGALPVAIAVELFHNFTLMHDDIMDAAPLRRGHATVHERWDANAGILSGDAMYTLAHMALSELQSASLVKVLPLFNATALEVCIGQQSDMAFERRKDVGVPEYLEMIRLKTSVLLAASLAMGASVAGANDQRVSAWYRLGEQLGLAFQMQDDLLDAFGDASTGKLVGGDILADKKTFLRLHAEHHNSEVSKWDGPCESPAEKVEAVQAMMRAAGAEQAARERMGEYVVKARRELDGLDLSPTWHAAFDSIADHIVSRKA
jgi:geranylgeranyl diphosphate synthase type II